MDIVEFFQQSSGKWFSQRTSHHPAKPIESGKSDLVIELLPQDHPAVVTLCQQYNVDPVLASCGIQINWDGSVEGDREKHKGTTVLVAVADSDKPNEGKLLREPTGANQGTSGRYILGSDEVLTLITESESLHSEERIWFASPNLRLRTAMVKQANGFSLATFCSEIRMGVPAPQPSTTNAASQA